MCGCVYVWLCNVWVCVCVGFVMCGCVYVGFIMCGCAYVGFVISGCVFVWVF